MSKRHLELTSSAVAPDSDFPNSAPLPQSTCIPSHLDKSRQGISRGDLSQFANDWLLDGQFRLHSPNTVATRRVFIKNLLWFLERRGFGHCGATELKHFFVYLSNGHEEPGGRWGNPQLKKPLRPISVKDYFVNFASMFDWFVAEDLIEISPMKESVPRPAFGSARTRPYTCSSSTRSNPPRGCRRAEHKTRQ